MTKTTSSYWNLLRSEHAEKWQLIEGLDDGVEQLALSIVQETGDYTRLSRVHPGVDINR